jgi:hypothetical protein
MSSSGEGKFIDYFVLASENRVDLETIEAVFSVSFPASGAFNEASVL